MIIKKQYLMIAIIAFVTATQSIHCIEPQKINTQQSQEYAQTDLPRSNAIIFTPPSGWRNADPSALPPHVKLMVVGHGLKELPPSMNLGVENYTGTLKNYLKRVKDLNRSKGYEWKDLGTIRTEAGNASLSQVDIKTEWGDVRMMHVILLRDKMIYILTAAALKEEFSSNYKEIFNSFRSLRFGKTPSNPTPYKPL